MPIITQKFIYRSDLQNNPDVWYLFGDNTKRVGSGGQAGFMRGEPNAIGIATKLLPSAEDRAFFVDAEFQYNKDIILRDMQIVAAHIVEGDLVVLPEDGLGTGLSELPKRAPKTNEYLLLLLKQLKEYKP